MLSDIEIAQGCKMRPIIDVAADAGLAADDLELYGKYKAKLSADVWNKLDGKENGKLDEWYAEAQELSAQASE